MTDKVVDFKKSKRKLEIEDFERYVTELLGDSLSPEERQDLEDMYDLYEAISTPANDDNIEDDEFFLELDDDDEVKELDF